ncbi:MAG: cation:proton antiporter [Polyangiales bacterium]
MNATSADRAFSPARSRTALVYGAMIAFAAAAFWLIHRFGAQLEAPPPVATRTQGAAPAASSEVLLHVLLALLVIVLAARGLGALFRYLSQPAVVGEVIAGIALGPSLLGAVAPDLATFILPAAIAPHLSVLAQVGVILFMFLVGLELDTSLLREKPHAALAISHASILAPFVLGAALALWIYPVLSTRDVPFGLFAMFMGVAMSITAFPVLARILLDRGLTKTRLGVIAISCAAVDDVTAWCLLAVIASMASPHASGALTTIVLTVAYVAFMLLLARPLIARLVRRVDANGEPTQGSIAVVFVALLLSALATEAIGIHAIFGAFVLGAIIPHEARFASALARRIEDVVVVLLLPAYFAFTGMRTQIGLVSGASHWLMCGVIVLVACAGKLGGSFLAARASGLSTRESASLGALMNTRGLMELVVLNLGLDLGVISPTLFAMMVLMAVITTMATSPLLTLFGTRAAPA